MICLIVYDQTLKKSGGMTLWGQPFLFSYTIFYGKSRACINDAQARVLESFFFLVNMVVSSGKGNSDFIWEWG